MDGKPVDVWDAVQRDMRERQQVGLARYGKPVTPDDAENWLQHQYEELLDAAVYCKAEILRRAGQAPAWTPADIPRREPLRFRLWNSDDVDAGGIVVDPFCVAGVIETTRRRAYGGNNDVAIIRMTDGKEYTVVDPDRKVAADIWLAKSFST